MLGLLTIPLSCVGLGRLDTDCPLVLGLLLVLAMAGGTPTLLRRTGLSTLRIVCVWVYMTIALLLRACGFDAGGGGGVGGWLGRIVVSSLPALVTVVVLYKLFVVLVRFRSSTSLIRVLSCLVHRLGLNNHRHRI